MISILFSKLVDMSLSSTPFAFIQEVTYFKRNEEILFSIHTIFQISDIGKLDDDKSLYQVDLKLTSNVDPHLQNLTDHMRKAMQESAGWHQLRQPMFKVGHFNQSAELYNELFDNSHRDSDTAHIYQQLSTMKDKQGSYKEGFVLNKNPRRIKSSH